MKTNKHFKFVNLFLITAFFIFFVLVKNVYAANGTIEITPSSGTFKVGDEFSIKLVINGGGENFNAAKATVTPALLLVKNVTLGDCGFAFVRTPTVFDPSFAGAILGKAASSCIVYTLKLQALEQGVSYITISNASIKAYKGAGELFSSVNQGRYVINNTTGYKIPSTTQSAQPPIVGKGGILYYNVFFDTGINDFTSAVLNPGKDNEIKSQRKDASMAVFENVPQGAHLIRVEKNGKIASEQLINVDGNIKDISIGIEKQKGILGGYIIIGIIGLTAIFIVLFYFFYLRKKLKKE